MDKNARLLEGFCELVRIDCPTRQEAEVATFLKNTLVSLGFEVEEDTAGERIGGNANNIFAFLKGTAPNAATLPTIMMTAHMDCVNPCCGIEPVIRDGVIYSKGETILGGDDKVGVIAIVEGIRRLQEEGARLCNIQVVFTVAEEGGVNGSKNMDVSKLKADFGYVFDSGGAPGEIVYAAPGINKIKAVITGKAAHAGVAPEKGINAIYVLSKALANFPQGRKDEETTANIGTISGGNATNVVADYAEVLVETRSLSQEKLEAMTTAIVDNFTNTAQEYGVEAEISVNPSYGGYKLDQNIPVIALAKKAAESLGYDVVFKRSGGGSDANNFNAHIPAVPLGTGMTNVHTCDECLKIEHLQQTCDWVVAILRLASK